MSVSSSEYIKFSCCSTKIFFEFFTFDDLSLEFKSKFKVSIKLNKFG